MRIRNAFGEKDLSDCVAIWFEASLAGHNFVPAEVWSESRHAMLHQYLPASTVRVACEEQSIIGFSAVHEGRLEALFVHPQHWGKGVGQALLHDLFDRHTSLTLSVYRKNERACLFYTRQGFVSLGEETCEHTGEEAITMRWQKAAE